MKTVRDPAVTEELRQRIFALDADSSRLWGNMTPHQVICHLTDAFRLTTGEKAASPAGGWFQRTVIKNAALLLPMQWPRGVPTRPEMDQLAGGTRPDEFTADRAVLLQYLDRFRNHPVRVERPVHPIFGALSQWQWDRWAYLHVDHHLRQFGK